MALEKVHRTALLLVVVLCLFGSIGLLICDRLTASESRSIPLSLVNRINPNLASVGSLTRLTGIGPVRAQSIVAYREALSAGDTFCVPFRTLQDLQKVKGIGPATLENIAPWLEFTSDNTDR
jgi:competence ComEA-like helix-hairpin-helix protein